MNSKEVMANFET